MIAAIIGTLITGLIIGFGGRAILPGAQDIGLPKTVGLGVVAAVIVGIIFSGLGAITSIVIGSIVAAGLLWLAIRQNWVTA
ncbi:MAG: GlsB/YeaQ/YmgE family stress response membrane protein [Actinomycetota bacterium]